MERLAGHPGRGAFAGIAAAASMVAAVMGVALIVGAGLGGDRSPAPNGPAGDGRALHLGGGPPRAAGAPTASAAARPTPATGVPRLGPAPVARTRTTAAAPRISSRTAAAHVPQTGADVVPVRPSPAGGARRVAGGVETAGDAGAAAASHAGDRVARTLAPASPPVARAVARAAAVVGAAAARGGRDAAAIIGRLRARR